MNLTGVLPLLAADPAVQQVIERARSTVREPLDVLVPLGARPPLVAALTAARTTVPTAAEPPGRGAAARADGPVVVVTATGREADDLAVALRCYLPPDDVAVLPAWETLPHERLSPRSDTVARRLAVFRRLAHPQADGDRHRGAGPVRVLVVPVRALLQPVVAGLGDLEPVSVVVGDQVDLAELADRLVGAAYSRVDMVERRGEFAVRGGILDVFPPTEEHPLRVLLGRWE